MGNEQSTETKQQEASTADTKVQNGDLNGLAVPDADLTEPVSKTEGEKQKCEIPAVVNANGPEPSPGQEEVDKANGPETSPDTETDAEPPKQESKPSGEEVSRFFGKMFKKKAEPVKPASESKDSVDGQSSAVEEQQTDIVFIKTDQEEIPEDAEENQLISIPTQHESVEGTSAIVPEDPVRGSQQPEMHTEKQTSSGDESTVGIVPISFKYEETATADAEESVIEDEELTKMVEMIISDGEEQLLTNVALEPKLNSDLVEESGDATVGPLLAKDISAIVEEILQITEDKVLGIPQKQLSNAEETMRQDNEAKESDVSSGELRNHFMKALDVAPEMLKSAVIVEDEIAQVMVNSISANGMEAADDESWVIIEEPAPPSTHASEHPGGVEEPAASPAKAVEERSSTERRSDLAKLFSHLRSVCTEALEGSTFKPVSVDVCGNESKIHITIQRDEAHCRTEPAAGKESAAAEAASEGTAVELLEDLVVVAEEISQSEDVQVGEKKVMNFFKTFKTKTKEAKAAPDASKNQKEVPAEPSANDVPPALASAAAKLEGKAEAAVKDAAASVAAVVKDAEASVAAAVKDAEASVESAVKNVEASVESAVKAAETSAKTKAKDKFSKMFRPKHVAAEETQTAEGEAEADASETKTPESTTPEEPPAAKPETKKLEKKSTFGKLFKSKAIEPKKQTAAEPALTESAPAAETKEEPKPAAPEAPAVPLVPDTQSADGADQSSPNIPPKLEKKDSIPVFLKNLVK